MDSVGQQRMAQLHADAAIARDQPEPLGPASAWCAGGAGTALVGDPQTVAARHQEYQDVGSIPSSWSAIRSICRKRIVSPNWHFAASPAAAEQCDTPIRSNTGGRSARPSQRTPARWVKASAVMPDEQPSAGRSLRLPRPMRWAVDSVPLSILVFWQAAFSTGWGAGACAAAGGRATSRGGLGSLLLSGELVRNIWCRFWRAGHRLLSLAAASALPFGLANGLSAAQQQLTDTTLQMVRKSRISLDSPCYPGFRIDESAKLFLVASRGVFFPIYLNTLHGNPQRRSAADRDGADLRHDHLLMFRRVIFPWHWPSTSSALRFALASCGPPPF